jgi:hypothetical protein
MYLCDKLTTLKMEENQSMTKGCLHIIVTLYGCTMAFFLVFLKFKKINKIKFIEIIKKGLTYLKLS